MSRQQPNPAHVALDIAAKDIVRGQPQALTPEQARLLNVAAWCYYTAPGGSALREALAPDFAAQWQRQRVRAAVLAPLFDAWSSAGVTVAAFKGLALAWGVYPHPALRFAGDVDVLIDPAHAAPARSVLPPGWHLVQAGAPASDLAFILFHEASRLMVEVHSCVVPAHCTGRQHGAAVTRAMLAAAVTPAQSPGVEVPLGAWKMLHPLDLALALALNRAWKSDAWRHKPHDYLDLLHLGQRHGATEAAVAARARALGVQRTWALFTEHCSPLRQRFDPCALRHSSWQRRRKDWTSWHGGLPPRLRAQLQLNGKRIPALARTLLALPVLLGVLRDLSSHPAPADVAAGAPQRRSVATSRPVWQIEQAARLAHRILRPLCSLATDAGPCVIESLTLHRMLLRHGHEAHWCLGYRQPGHADEPIAHAWVELDDPYALGIPYALRSSRYGVVFRSAQAADANALAPHA